MRLRDELVNAVVTPPLFRYEASAVSLSALCDGVAQEILFVVEARNPSDGSLCSLWSSKPLPLDRMIEGLHEAHSEFLTALWDASGPFA